MKNTFGQSISLTLFGESHGNAIGAVLDGLAPGLDVDEEFIKKQLSRRRPSFSCDTPRREPDNFSILSGVFNGKTTGTPLCIVIPNENTDSKAYNYGIARPSHADYTAFCKYHGFEDYRGGGHFSGRITAALVAACAIIISALGKLNIEIGTHILRCSDVFDHPFEQFPDDIKIISNAPFPFLESSKENDLLDAVSRAKENGDSLGGVTQTAICGLPCALGEPWFDSMEGVISHAVFSIGGIKGIEFGAGFSFADMTGSVGNDPFSVEKGKITAKTNFNGGINGGITNGMPVVFQCAVKPTPSISKEQETVDFLKKENALISVAGRHDPAIIRRICPVIDSVTALVVADMLAQRFGTDVLLKGFEK